jgi:hypothetical protein
VFENRMLKKIFGPKRDEVTGGWRNLHNEEFYNFYSSPSIIRMNTSRTITWAGHVAQIGGKEESIYIIGGKARRKETTRKPRCRWGWTVLIWLRTGTGLSSCEHTNEPFGSIKC